MQNVGQSDNKRLENSSKVSVTSTSMNSNNSSSGGGSGSSNNGKIMSTPLNKFSSNNSSPAKSDTETFSEFQPRVTDSESDEESVSEVRANTFIFYIQLFFFFFFSSFHAYYNIVEKKLHVEKEKMSCVHFKRPIYISESTTKS